MDPNVLKGKQFVFLIRNDADTLWEVAGGVKSRAASFNNPTEDTTSSSTQGDYSEKEWTGYSDVSLNLSGLADKRTGVADPVTGFNIVGADRLATLATTGQRQAKCRMVNVDSGGAIEGVFTISTYTITGETPGLKSFECSLESAADVITSGLL